MSSPCASSSCHRPGVWRPTVSFHVPRDRQGAKLALQMTLGALYCPAHAVRNVGAYLPDTRLAAIVDSLVLLWGVAPDLSLSLVEFERESPDVPPALPLHRLRVVPPPPDTA